MGGTIVCIATVLLGVDASWPELPDGGRQYTIRIEPQVLERLASGTIEAVESSVPPSVADVRAFRIVLGTPSPTGNAAASNAPLPMLGDQDHVQWVRLPSGGHECRVWIPSATIQDLDASGRVIEGPIPVEIDRLRLFTISVGTKPIAEDSFAAKAPGPADPNVADPNVADPNVADPNVADPNVADPEVADPFAVRPPPTLPVTEPSLTQPSLTRQPEPLPRIERPFPFASPEPTLPAVDEAEPARVPSEAAIGSKPIPVQQTNHVEPAETPPGKQSSANEKSDSSTKLDTNGEDPAKLPLPSTLTLLALFVSLGGNLFLLWVMRDFRNRYRMLRQRIDDGQLPEGLPL